MGKYELQYHQLYQHSTTGLDYRGRRALVWKLVYETTIDLLWGIEPAFEGFQGIIRRLRPGQEIPALWH